MSLAQFIFKFLKTRKLPFVATVLLSLTWTFEMLFWPFFLRKIVDITTQFDLDRTSAWPALKPLLLTGAWLWLLMEFGFRSRDWIVSYMYPKLEADIRMTMFDHVQRHSPKYFNEHFSGSLASRIGEMVTSVIAILRSSTMLFIPSIASSLAVIVIFSQINFAFTWIIGGWVILHCLLCCLLTKKCAAYSFQHGVSKSALVGKIVDSLTNNFVVNSFFRFRFEKEQISRYQVQEQKDNHTAQLYATKMFAALSCGLLLEMFALTWFMLFYWSQGSISTGEVVQLFYTVWNVSMIFMHVADRAPELFQAYGVAKQALQILEDPQDILDSPGASDLTVLKGEIRFVNVSFAYGNRPIFENKNLTVKAGERVGLVGYSGAGKSTFVNLILRFFAVSSGKITIDGQDISKVTLESLRNQIALIPQDPILFHRTLEENIRYGKIDATYEEVISAAKLAHCHEFIQKFPKGYDSLVGERGTKLSGGEKQRVAIARAMLLKAPILILDEATSALDSVTEKYIQESLGKLMGNRTTIVIAHRLSTLSMMDRILVFDQGILIEEGAPEELLQKNGHYAHMWKMQAGGFLPS